MTRNTLIRLRNFILLSLAQVLVFSQIHLFGYATACIFVIYLIKMPRHTTRNEMMTWAFLFGLVTDIFCNTPGIHAAAATTMAFARNYILATFTHKGLPDDFTPGAKSLKWGSYIIYSLMCTSIFYAVLFILELFAVRYFATLLIGTASSTLLTMLFLVVTELFTPKK